MNSVQYYSTIHPQDDEFVLVEFTSKEDSFFKAKLLEYPYTGIMNLCDATKKRKVSSWNKIVTLNKPSVARIESIDTKSKIVQLSIAYFDDEKEIQTLMSHFTENKMMENFINSLCILHNYVYEDLWTKIVHPLDVLRREDDYVSLWNFFSNNIDVLDEILEDKELFDQIKDLFLKKTEKKSYKIVSRVGIISSKDINMTKQLLSSIFNKDNIKFNYTFKYEATPNYLFESWSEDSNKEDHERIIKMIENNAIVKANNVFVKVDYIGKTV